MFYMLFVILSCYQHNLQLIFAIVLPLVLLRKFAFCFNFPEICKKLEISFSHRVGSNQKRYHQSTNADQKLIETVFLIAICRPTGDKWQSKKRLFLLIFIYVPR